MMSEALWYVWSSEICVIIGSGNDLEPGRHQAITWTNDNWTFSAYFGNILIKIEKFSQFDYIVICEILVILSRS